MCFVPAKKSLWGRASTSRSASWKRSPDRPRGLRRCTWAAEVDSDSRPDLWTRPSRRTRPGHRSKLVAFSGPEAECSSTTADSVSGRFRFCPDRCCVTELLRLSASSTILERLHSWVGPLLAGVGGVVLSSCFDLSSGETIPQGRCSVVRESPV